MASNNIYKSGVPPQYGTSNYQGLGTQPSQTGKGNYPSYSNSASYGTPVLHGPNSDNGTTQYKPCYPRNTPQS